jgi:proline racemase
VQTLRVVQCVDTHSCGEATRVVLGGIPPVKGATMRDRYVYFKDNLDELRTALFQEPRGFENMLGAFVLDPTREDADFGVIYAGATQYFEMCGDSTFSLAKTLVETGMVAATEPITTIRLDTYGGIVEVQVRVENGCVGDITYRSVPAFFLKTTCIQSPGLGEVEIDIAFGGLWYGFVNARDVGIDIELGSIKKILTTGMILLDAVNHQTTVEHPEDPALSGVALLSFYDKNPEPGVDYRTANVYGDNATCRSPAGTMSAARASVSHAKRELETGEQLVIRNGWIGSEHRVRVAEETTVSGLPAVIPELTATAFVTGFHSSVIEHGDPYGEGFLL